jgi:hypothetical protein
VPPSRVLICSFRENCHITFPSKSCWTSSSDSWFGGRAPLAEMTKPPGSTRAGPPAELLRPSQRLTTLPFMSITSTAGVCSGDNTVYPFHERSGS